jgi:hypothetical protein
MSYNYPTVADHAFHRDTALSSLRIYDDWITHTPQAFQSWWLDEMAALERKAAYHQRKIGELDAHTL